MFIAANQRLFRKHHATRGVTLIEIAVVIAVIGIIVAIGVPSHFLMSWNRLRSGARLMASDLVLARMRAVSGNQSYGIHFHDGGSPGGFNEYTLFRDDGTTAGTLDDGDTIEKDHVALPSGVSCNFTFVTNQAVMFDPIGAATGGRLTFSNNSKRKILVRVVSHTGAIRICNLSEET